MTATIHITKTTPRRSGDDWSNAKVIRPRALGGFQPQPSFVSDAQVALARTHFFKSGWSYRSAGKQLGRSYQHLCQVLNGQRHSKPMIEEILKLPIRK